MKFETFEILLNNCKNLYDTACDRDEKLQNVLGGDTQIMTDWWSKYIEETLKAISLEFGRNPDEDDTIDWLFWDSMCNKDGYLNIEIEEINYVGSPKNIYLMLNNMLDERLGETVHEDVCADEEYREEKLETHFMQTKEIKDNEENEENSDFQEEFKRANGLNKINETSKEKIIRYFQAAGIEVIEEDTNLADEIVLRMDLNPENLFDDIKKIGYEEQLFRINLLGVRTLDGIYHIEFFKIK